MNRNAIELLKMCGFTATEKFLPLFTSGHRWNFCALGLLLDLQTGGNPSVPSHSDLSSSLRSFSSDLETFGWLDIFLRNIIIV